MVATTLSIPTTSGLNEGSTFLPGRDARDDREPAPPVPALGEEAGSSGLQTICLADNANGENLKADGLGLNWVTNPVQDASADDEPAGNGGNDDDEDDLWGAARKEAKASNAQEADRAKREEKMRAKAEVAAQKRMAEAQELGVQARAKREEQEAEDARLREEHEREVEESRRAAREEAIKEVNDQRQTVDLDPNRHLGAELAGMGVEIDQGIEDRDVWRQDVVMKRARSDSNDVDNSSPPVKRAKTNVK